MSKAKRPICIEDLYRLMDVSDPHYSPDGQWLAYVRQTIDRPQNAYQRNIWLVSTHDGRHIQLTRSGKDSEPRWSPDGQWLAFSSSRDKKSQVYLLPMQAPGGEAKRLTNCPNGASSPAWSPDSQRLAFLAGMNQQERAGESQVEDSPTDELAAKHRIERREHDEKQRLDPRKIERLPYREGTAFISGHYLQIYVLNIHDETPQPQRLTDSDANYSTPHWTADGQSLISTRPSRLDEDEPRRWSQLYRLDARNGSETQLTSDEAFIVYTPQVSPDGQWVAYNRFPRALSSRANLELAVLALESGEIRHLNIGDRSVEAWHWTADSQAIVYSVTDRGQTPLYRIGLDAGISPVLTDAAFVISEFSMTPEGEIAFSSATPASPPEIYRLTPSGEVEALTQHQRAFLDEVSVQAPYEIWVKAPDGWDVQGWYLLPPDFDPAKRYPLLLSIHGGPHLMYGPSERGMWHEWQVQAAAGYVVLYINARGSDGYGAAFRDGVYGAWGKNDMPDQMAALDALLAKGFVDAERLFITGGSYGGFMTTWIVSHSQIFKAAVAQRGVYHFMGFYGSTDIPQFVATELGVEPWENPQQLWESSPVAYAHEIKTPVLLIHAENDFRVPISEAELMFALLKRLGKTVKLIRYPNDGHEMSRTGEPAHRISRLEEMLAWFASYDRPAPDA